MERLKVYLAGPDVFLHDAEAVLQQKKAICAEAGFEGVSPLDGTLSSKGMEVSTFAISIARANEAAMDGCDLIIANMTPFRGPSMDVGTAYEIGYMRGQGKPIFGYSNSPDCYFHRVKEAEGGALTRRFNSDKYEDADGMEVEHFGLSDNLMIEGAVCASKATIWKASRPGVEIFRELSEFKNAVSQARTLMDQAGSDK